MGSCKIKNKLHSSISKTKSQGIVTVRLKQNQNSTAAKFSAWCLGLTHDPLGSKGPVPLLQLCPLQHHSLSPTPKLAPFTVAVVFFGGHPTELTSPKWCNLCNWAVPSPIISPGLSSGTVTLPHGAKSQLLNPGTWLQLKLHLLYGLFYPPMVPRLRCSP